MTTKSKAKKDPPMRVHIVGPAMDRDKALSRLDSDEEKRGYLQFLSIRDHLVAISKRVKREEKSAIKKGRAQVRSQMRGRSRVRVRKAALDDGTRAAPTAGTDRDTAAGFDYADAIIPPPYPFDAISSLYENSGPLQRNIDGMAANIDGFGYTFEAILDFSHPDVNDRIRELMFLERLEKKNLKPKDLDESHLDELEPTLEEVKKTRKLWERIAMVEKHHLSSFFESLHPRFAFTRLRVDMRKGLELFGNGAWEILREKMDDVYSQIEQVYNVPFTNIQLIAQDKWATPMKVKVRKGAVRWDELTFKRFFRRFIQTSGSSTVFYKEFGDPRIVSRTTGAYYNTLDELREKEGSRARPANELLHFVIPSPLSLSPYGMNRWIGVLLAVLGNRASEEVNFLYFDNKAIPPMVLLCSGGQLSDGTIARLEKFLTERLTGRRNFHKILVIEGIPSASKESPGDVEPSSKLRLEIKPLTSDMLQDGLFQHYDEANELKIGRAFRQPPLLTGDQRDANRSTADVVKAIAEEQVYQPSRDMFDADMDRLFLSNLGVRFWKFKTNAPAQRYPNDLVANAVKALLGGAMTPNEARPVIGRALAVELPHRSDPWANTPPALSAAAASTGGEPGKGAFDALDSKGDQDDEEQAPEAVTKALKTAVVARGKTSEEAGHSHDFKVVRDGDHARIVTSPAGEDMHTHPDEVVRYKQGTSTREILDVAAGHSHEARVRFYSDRRQERVRRVAKSLISARDVIREQLGDVEKAFFDARD